MIWNSLRLYSAIGFSLAFSYAGQVRNMPKLPYSIMRNHPLLRMNCSKALDTQKRDMLARLGCGIRSAAEITQTCLVLLYLCLIFADSQGLLYLSLPENNPPLCHLRNRVNNLQLEHSQHKHQSSDAHITWELKTCPPSMQVIRTCPPKGTVQPSCSHMARLNPFQSSVHGAHLNWLGNPWGPSISFASVFWFDSTLAAWPSLYSILEGAYISVFKFPKPPQIVRYTTSAQDTQSLADEFKSRFHRTTDNNDLACRGVEHQQLLLISNGVKSPHYFQGSQPNSTTQEHLKTAAYKFCLEICNDQQETANSVL